MNDYYEQNDYNALNHFDFYKAQLELLKKVDRDLQDIKDYINRLRNEMTK